MTPATLHDALFELQLARFDTLDAPASPASEVSLLAALRAAGWSASGSQRQGGVQRMTDLELARAARDGDGGALAQLCERYRDRLVAYACSAGCSSDADDVTQAAFVSLWTTAKLDDPNFDVRRYLFRAVRNQVIKHALRRARVDELGDEELLADSEARNALEHLLAREHFERGVALIDARCTLAQQSVLALMQAGHGDAEIAEQLELTTGNVRVIRHRALARLRASFDEDPA